MNRNQVLPQVELSAEPSALKKVDFCTSQTYRGTGFLSIDQLPRLAQEASVVLKGDGFDWEAQSNFEDSPGSEPLQTLDLGLKGRIHLICQRCLQDCAVDLAEKRRFVLLATEDLADDYPIEDDEREALVASQHFNLLETIEDEVLLSLPLIPKHPEGFCEPHASSFGGGAEEAVSEKPENPFNILKNMKKM